MEETEGILVCRLAVYEVTPIVKELFNFVCVVNPEIETTSPFIKLWFGNMVTFTSLELFQVNTALV